MTQLLRTLFLPLCVFVLAGCTSKPVYNAEEHFSSRMAISNQQMQRAIVSALNDRQWTVQAIEPGKVQAMITVRGRHHAEVDIPFSPTSFKILYRSSWGLDYKDGKINGNYNRWVNMLRDNVLKALNVNPVLEGVDNLGIVKQGSEDAVYFNFQQGVQRATDAGLLDGSVGLYLAGQPLPGKVHKLDNVVSNKKTNGANKTDEEACLWALQSALVTLQAAAKKAGANAVVDIVSYYNRDQYQDPVRFQCRAGTLITGVALKGTLAKLQ